MSFLGQNTTSTSLEPVAHSPITVVLDEPSVPYVAAIGIPGPKGDPGTTFTFNQSNPATVWYISHGLNKYPSVTVIDSTGEVVDTDIEYIDFNNLTSTAAAAFSGTAYCV